MENNNLEELLEQGLQDAGLTPEQPEDKEPKDDAPKGDGDEPKSADTPADEPKDETPADGDEPKDPEPKDEPKDEPKAGDPEDLLKQATEEPKLILGKFKTQADLEKAYQNLEKQYTQKSQRTADVARSQDDAYWDNEIAKAEDIVAKDIVTKALDTISDPAQKTEAMTAMNKWLQTGDAEDLSKCLGYMDVRVERQVRSQAMDAWQRYCALRH